MQQPEPGSDPGMARGVYVPAPQASSVTVTVGQRAQVKVPGQRTRKVTLDPGDLYGTPVRNQGPGRSLPGPDAGHPLHYAGRYEGISMIRNMHGMIPAAGELGDQVHAGRAHEFARPGNRTPEP